MLLTFRLLLRAFSSTLRVLMLCLVSFTAFSQTPSQTVRGLVVDKITQSPLPGAIVTVLNTSPLKGAASDMNGRFSISGVPLGKHTVKVTYLGYKESIIPDVNVNAGKEVVLTIQMEENITEVKEVVITSKNNKNRPLNEMSAVSTRTFSVEETQKFAAAVNDPARMATSFAGVVAANDGNNTISVRGNSPNALLWRLEGMDIPNPNHYSAVGTSGGGVSILSAQVLGNSDFLTGAFASEYGNAIGGVFDLRFRKGNNQKREYTFQAGVLGFDFATEGPFKKGYDGSYLVNYRYSTLSVLGLMGVNVAGDARLDFQDLSFNVSLPTERFGTFGVFGLGGLSKQTMNAVKDSSVWKDDARKQYPAVFASNTGVIGLNNTRLFGRRSVLRTTLVLSATENLFYEDKFDNSYKALRNYDESYLQGRLALSSVFTHKFSAKHSLRSGFIASSLNYDLNKQYRDDSSGIMQTFISTSGSTQTYQAFGQWNWKISSRLTANAGLHSLLLALNNSYSVEPRASLRYDLTPAQNITFGYGLHSQVQPLGAYFSKDRNSGTLLNSSLGLTKAHHYVLSHDISLNAHTHIKTEAYYQHLFNVPVNADPSGTFSMLNVTDGYSEEALVNRGLGRNYGLELTVERFTHRNFYYLLSLSLYESKYQAANHQWYDTRFNTNYAGTLTAGKEWQLSAKRKSRVIGLNGKLVYIGGFRNSPLDLARSIAENRSVYDESQPFTVKNKDYFRIDIRVSIKRNYAKLTSTLSLDLQNATNNQNIAGRYFDQTSGTVKYAYQAGLIPVLAYRIEF